MVAKSSFPGYVSFMFIYKLFIRMNWLYIYIYIYIFRVCHTIRLVPIRFWQMGDNRLVSTLHTAVWQRCLWRVRVSRLTSTTCSNLLIIEIEPAAIAHKYVFIHVSFIQKSNNWQNTMVHPLWTHSHGVYDNNGKDWLFRLVKDNKMIYEYTHSFT